MAEEEPVIVSGGSVTIEFKDNFHEDPPPAGKKKYKKDGARLLRIMVNNEKVRDLDEKDKVEIICEVP